MLAGLAQELTSELRNVEDSLGDLLGLNTASAEDAPVVRLLYSVFEEALRVRASLEESAARLPSAYSTIKRQWSSTSIARAGVV